jgi:hypothetical protein
MTPNAFTLPATGIQFKQQSAKQRKDSATRVNRYEPLCTKNDTVKTQRIQRSAI